jgi:hypothetical protein
MRLLKSFIQTDFTMIKLFRILPLLCLAGVMMSCDQSNKSAQQGDETEPTVDVTGLLDLPFDYSFGVDNKLYLTTIDSDNMLAEFSAWGSTAYGHTGHVEGDGKSNYSVYIQPSTGLIEFTGVDYEGNDDGTCDAGEICGVTAETAISNAPWYKVPHDDMELVGATYDHNSSLGHYVNGEGNQWGLTFRYGNHWLALGHIGELSATLEAALVERFGNEVSSPTASLNYSSLFYDPIPMPKGTIVARPQVTFSFSETEDIVQVYYAHAQVEWSWMRDDVNYTYWGCGYAPLLPEVKTGLQAALEAALKDPVPYGRFLSYLNTPPVEPAVAAHSVLCATPAQRDDNFSRLSVTDSRAWFDNKMTYPNRKEIFSVFPVETGNSAYTALGGSLYDDAEVRFMLYRGHADGESYIRLQDSGTMNTFDIRAMWAQILNMTPADDIDEVTTSAWFVARVEPHQLRVKEGSNSPANKFVAVRYRLFSDRLVTHWGSLEDSEAAAISNLPAAIPATVTCDGNPYFCYDHDFLSVSDG